MGAIGRILDEIGGIMERDPAARTRLEVFICYSGLHAVMGHWFAHWLWRKKFYLFARIVSQVVRFLTGIEIHPGATIGKRLFIDHGMGVVIGETAEIGDDVLIYSGAVLGAKRKAGQSGRRHPKLGNNVLVGTGAKILGGVTIGDNAKIGANAIVVSDLPVGSTAVADRARIISPKERQ